MDHKSIPAAFSAGSHVDGRDRVMDLEITLDRLGGNRGLFDKLVQFYFDDAPQLLEQLRHAARHGDVTQVERSAHTLKSLAANFEALSAARAALNVEDYARADDLESAIECIPELDRQLRRLDATLASYVDSAS